MALQPIRKYYFYTTGGLSSYAVGDTVIVYRDDVSGSLVVHLNGVVKTTLPPLILSIFYARVTDYNYFWCTEDLGGSTKNYFSHRITFPFVKLEIELNSAQCGFYTCDIAINGIPTIVKASTPNTADGEITIHVTGTQNEYWYSLEPITNVTGSSSGKNHTFSNVLPGNYTVYVKDVKGCEAQVNVLVGYEIGYLDNALYDFTFYDNDGQQYKLEIFDTENFNPPPPKSSVHQK